jgi:hypothetical protein
MQPVDPADLERIQVPQRNRMFYRASLDLASAAEDPSKSGLEQLTPDQITNQQQVLALYTSFLSHLVQNPHLIGNLPLSAFMPAYLASALPGASGAILETAILHRERDQRVSHDPGLSVEPKEKEFSLAESTVAGLLEETDDWDS